MLSSLNAFTFLSNERVVWFDTLILSVHLGYGFTYSWVNLYLGREGENRKRTLMLANREYFTVRIGLQYRFNTQQMMTAKIRILNRTV